MSREIVLPTHLGHSVDEAGKTDRKTFQGAEAIAKAFGVERHTILRWKKAGAPVFLIGRKYQGSYDKIMEWIEKNEKQLYRKSESR